MGTPLLTSVADAKSEPRALASSTLATLTMMLTVDSLRWAHQDSKVTCRQGRARQSSRRRRASMCQPAGRTCGSRPSRHWCRKRSARARGPGSTTLHTDKSPVIRSGHRNGISWGRSKYGRDDLGIDDRRAHYCRTGLHQIIEPYTSEQAPSTAPATEAVRHDLIATDHVAAEANLSYRAHTREQPHRLAVIQSL